jgi:hypothetical protein
MFERHTPPIIARGADWRFLRALKRAWRGRRHIPKILSRLVRLRQVPFGGLKKRWAVPAMDRGFAPRHHDEPGVAQKCLARS